MKTALKRFMEKVDTDPDSDCWLWSGYKTSKGYGQFRNGEGKTVRAHRWIYMFSAGEIPEGLELDHVCGVRHCVNPDHLEAVTHGENLRRGGWGNQNVHKTECHRGHPFSGENLYVRPNDGNRACKACQREANRKSRDNRKGENQCHT